jgi:hypothetical protein
MKAVYDRLGELLDRGDDAFIEEGLVVIQEALQDPGFLNGVETEPAVDSYTRAKVIGGGPEDHVIRYMEWPPEYSLLPHEHHGRPCFEVLVEGMLVLTDMEPVEVADSRYELHPGDVTVCRQGEAGVVDPRTGHDVHAVYSPERCRSLHCYPNDKSYSFGYVPENESDPENDRYVRKRFDLDSD